MITSKLPNVGTTIFTVMSQLAAQTLSNRKLSTWLGHWREQVPVDIRMTPKELARRIGS